MQKDTNCAKSGLIRKRGRCRKSSPGPARAKAALAALVIQEPELAEARS